MPSWRGRRLLAALDAVAWPALSVAVWLQSRLPGRLVGAVVAAVCVIAGGCRLRRAIWFNHRYRFTTWRWGRGLMALLLFGLLLRLVLHL